MANDECRSNRLLRTSAFIILTSSFLAGCSPYAQVQMALVDQSRKGIENARATQASYVDVVDQLHALQRQRLDDAFDADAQATPNLDAQWVIDARRVYAAAIDAMAERRFAAKQSATVAQRNLDAVDQALQRLKWLQAVPLSWFEDPK
jgi:hypothetical protein